MGKLREAIVDLVEDLTSVEVAIVEEKLEDNKNVNLLSYSKIEMEGDTINFFPNVTSPNQDEILELHRALISTSSKCRATLRNVAIEALT